MKTRNTLIALAAAAATVAGLTAPAFADSRASVTISVGQSDRWDGNRGNGRWDDNRGNRWDNHGGRQVENRISHLRQRIETGRRSGQISGREAERLQYRLREIVAMRFSFQRSGHGLDGREVAVLDQRIDNLNGQIRYERRDYNRR